MSADSSSLDRNYHIRSNDEGDHELHIPAWDEGSSDTYTHVLEELRIYKNKCRHLEQHLEESMREFRELNELHIRLEVEEERLLIENDGLKNRAREIKKESVEACSEKDRKIKEQRRIIEEL